MLRLRLHKSTIIVALIAAVWLVLVNIPGRVTDWQPASFFQYEHGWPWVCLKREALDDGNGVSGSRVQYAYRRDAMQNLPGLGVTWVRGANWRFWEQGHNQDGWRWDWDGRIVFANGAIAIAVLVGSVAAWEWRRRRRNSWFHFSLAEIFLVVTSVSAVLGWLVHMEREFNRETRVEELSFAYTNSDWYVRDYTCIAPVWVRSLIGEKLLPEFTWRVARVGMDAGLGAASPEKSCQEIAGFSYLQTVSVSTTYYDGPPFPFGQLSRLRRLKYLELDIERPLEQHDIDELSQLVRLEVLALLDIDDESPAIISRLKSELPGSRIINMYEDEYYDIFPYTVQ